MRRKKWIIIAIVVLLIGGCSIGMVVANKGDDQGIHVKTIPLRKQNIESHVETTGHIESMDKREIVSDVEEKIENMLVEKGDYVKKGQVLMELEKTNINYKIKEASLKLETEKEKLDRLKKQGDTQLKIDMDNDYIKYKDCQKKYENNVQLHEEGILSQEELEDSKDEMDTAYNQYLSAKEKIDHNQAQSEIKNQERGVQLAKLDLEKLQEDYKKHTIKSPITGTIVDTKISESGIIESHVTLMYIQDIDHLQVVADMNEYDASHMKVGDPVTITGDGFEGKTYKGYVEFIGRIAKELETGRGKENVVEVKIHIDGIDQYLKPGFEAKLDILTDEEKNVWTVPYESIFTKKNGEQVIFTLKGDQVVEKKIKVGIESDLEVQVLAKGLKENEEVILNPTETIKEGIKVIKE